MNKYEKLIEYIINENEQKARELFHEIVVEKSRDIYESIMDDEQINEFGGDAQEDLVDSVTSDETGGLGEGDDEGEEFSLDSDEGGEEDGLSGDLGGDDLGGDEMGGDELGGGDEPATKGDIADLADQLEDLKALFADQEAGSDMDGEEEFGGEESGAGEEEFGGEEGGEEMGSEEGGEEMFAEGEQPEWLKKKGSGSGKSGSGASGSGKSGSGKSGSGKSGSGVAESKSVAQLMREYVDTIGQVYGGEGDNAEGTEAGNGKKVPVNSKSISRTSGPDFGGTNKNIARGGAEQSPDGKQTPKPNNEYSKGETKFSSEKFQNVAGGSKKQSTVGKNWESEKGAEGQTTSGKVPVSDKTVLKQNTGK